MESAKTGDSRRLRLRKAPTGVAGLDVITGGGLPKGRATLLLGGPGSGKTILALKFLVHGAAVDKEPGIFVAFEESSARIMENAASFSWKLDKLAPKRVFFVDAMPPAGEVHSGEFDLGGLLAALGAQVKAMGARRIVLDALDIPLSLLADPAARRREVYRLHEWLVESGLTAVITAKADAEVTRVSDQPSYGFMQFMVDCALILNHGVVNGVSQRNLRVQKYRGSSFDENESPYLIGEHGLEVMAAAFLRRMPGKVSDERVSSGVKRLDTMLGGGYYRRASVLVTGLPGTAKTTLSGAFAEAACKRGERTLFVNFDSDSNEVVRDLGSVGIQLASYLKSGRLRMASARNITGSAETYLERIKCLAREHRARCVVIDPISKWSTSGKDSSAHSIGERLIDWTKAEGITLLCTSLTDDRVSDSDDGVPTQMSSLADTWIHLNYLVQAGERNRGLSIIKSRGTAHSNQVRELVLSDEGVTLTDTYTAGGEVLMGTLRWEKESAERVAREVTEVAGKLKNVRLDAEEAELMVRVRSLQVELEAKQVEKALLHRTTQTRQGELSRGRTRMDELREADAPVRRPKATAR